MAEQESAARPKPVEKIVKLRPTLYIGVGGTGMEVILRVRRRILAAAWGPARNPVRISSLAEFPVAQFIHFDLDQGALVESGKSQRTDPLADAVKLSDEDRLVESFEIERYSRSDDDLAKYPYIENWSPLTPKKIREMGIDPAKGAGQIRAISRLYFFDKYTKVKEKIRSKLVWLKSGLSKDTQLKALGLDLDQSKFRIVVIGSVAGGTGAGSFLDMGWLANWIAKETVSAADVEMMVFLPTGYQSANKERTEANGYASFMELETCMRGGSHFVTRWDAYDRPQLSVKPYDEVYLIDSGNLAQLHTSNQKDIYDMVADALFEDFASIDFANKKRSVAVNQRQHKILPFTPPVPGNRYGDMRLSYYQGYSAFGQSVLDTQRGVQRDMRAYYWTAEMVKAFFGVALENVGARRATDKQRDDFMAQYIQLVPHAFTNFPELSDRRAQLNRAEFTDSQITDSLLIDRQGSLIDGMLQKVGASIERIASGNNKDEWGLSIREAFKQLERDVVRDQDSTADATEDRVSRGAAESFIDTTTRIRDQLYVYLDNKEHGGLEYVLSLVEQIKDRLENPSTGLIAALADNARRYGEIRDVVRTCEYDRLLNNLDQTKGGGLFSFGNKEEQARLILGQIREEICHFLQFHLRATAAAHASALLKRVSQWLGERQGIDGRGDAAWSGLVGEIQAGRNAVLAMIDSVEGKVTLLREDTRKDHATYILVETPEEGVALPPTNELRAWADEVFTDIGGSRTLFPMLAEPKERERLIGLLRVKAEQQIAAASHQQPDEGDPLLLALEAMTPTERQRRFEELITRAMPWVDASWGKDFEPKPDQFKCYIGVASAAEYEKRFKEELLMQVPAGVGISPAQVAFVDTGVPGRAVCYCELSGIPLTTLRGMEAWRTSYRKESEKIPLHTHRDSTQFTHPLAPSTSELNRLADDFYQFLSGVMLGILSRDARGETVPPGQYVFAVSRGDTRRIGNERAFRLNGLPETYHSQILAEIGERINGLNPTQFVCLAVLADYYAKEVYTPCLVSDETGNQKPVKGFPAAMAEEMARDWREKARRMGTSAADGARAERQALEQLDAWSQRVENSDADAYPWEVKEGELPRVKRVVRPIFFQIDALDALLELTAPTQAPRAVGAPTTQPAPTIPGAVPPPPFAAPTPQYQYFLAMNGQQHGPYPAVQLQQWVTAGQLDAATLAWRDGLPAWAPLNQIAELASLFTVSPPPPIPGAPGMPPALPPGT
ncbi:tubulin-like doman-containing protein [uncultured Thiodictyon sp.]|uniref:tubulin-like doman-containing protein n=1 Tax=uncultured Thiodictyon sp. TaxID=1846217 RepID=UPI0025F63E1D|nr:tubulin-like doman-containing protein [uncultured Thiodictyon sp.]